jgi:hypothetical protein
MSNKNFRRFLPFVLVLSATALFASVSSAAQPMYGVMMVVKGSVKIKDPGAPAKASDAKVGTRVVEGNMVVTGTDSRAKIVMSDRNVINVNPDTEVVIAKYENDGTATGKRNVELNLLKGRVRNNVEQTYDGEKNKFQVKTPTAVAGVRGTQFLTSYDQSTRTTSIVTFKGAVAFASLNAQGAVLGAPVVVSKGQTAEAAANAAPAPPKTMPKEDIKRIDGESSSTPPPPKREAANESERKTPAEKNSEKSPVKMIDARDTDTGIATDIKDPRNPAPPPPAFSAPPPPLATPNPLVKEIVRENNGLTHVNVRPVQQ